jgi:AcrR family transcriptional regulator
MARVVKEYDERREEFLDISEKLFSVKGYNKTSVQDIIKEIGVAKGTFYYYFKSKEEIMDAIIMRYVDIQLATADKILNEKLPAHEKMEKLFWTMGRTTERKVNLVDNLHEVNNKEMQVKSIVEAVKGLTPILTQIVEQGIEENVYSTENPKETIEFMFTGSQFLLDDGIFDWTIDELLYKALIFTKTMDKVLSAKEGSFYFIYELYQSVFKG